MTAVIENIGELASPYYLVELWAREWDINLDPESYASLKRKTRRLVSEAQASEIRGDRLGADWEALRLEILGVDQLDRQSVTTDAGEVEVAYCGAGPENQVLLGELDSGVDPDRRDPDTDLEEPPAAAFELVLEDSPRGCDWGLLCCGSRLRLYRRGTGVAQQYVALDLEGLVSVNDDEHWKAFAGIFRQPAFVPDDEGVPLVQRVCDESRAHATRLAEDMRGDVVYAAESLIQGALDIPENEAVLGSEPGPADLNTLFEQTLYILYRLLFVLYAESRDILPVRAGGPYATTYSVDHLVERARSAAAPMASETYTAETLRCLFDLLGSGPPELSTKLGVPVLGGELFDPDRTETFNRLEISEQAWRDALVALAIGAPDSARAAHGRRSSFAELGVDQLGSIYEGLLVLEPSLAQVDSVLTLVKGERRVLEKGADLDASVVREFPAGTFVLENAGGRRKGSGSFYTPAEITEFLAEQALSPLIEPLIERATEGDVSGAERELLSLAVCDPAMGSGAFLVQATRVLGRGLARIRAKQGNGRVTPEAIKRCEARVVRSCLYGVDLNPLAVALAKVSLWLETIQPDHPLTFLDARLRVGDSLVGAQLIDDEGRLDLGELTTWRKDAVEGLKKYLKDSKVHDPDEPEPEMLGVLKDRKGLRKAKQATLPGIAAHEVTAAINELVAERERLTGRLDPDADPYQLELDAELRFNALEDDEEAIRNRLQRAADFWCAQWFWPANRADFESFDVDPEVGVIAPPGQADFNAIVAHSLDPSQDLPDELQVQLEIAEQVAADRSFFHWELEFPEVMIERGGFDAVLGNPPWNTLSPDVKEFFSTFDPITFARGVAKPRQDARRVELLEQDDEIERRWRAETRRLHQLGAYLKPKAARYTWFPEDGQLRKGDANVFRQFVERAYGLLRGGGRIGQVLPDSAYVSSPTTELRRRLLDDGLLECCFVFENRRKLFPIDTRLKIMLLLAERGGGPTEDFAAAFLTGKDANGDDRAIGLNELPATLSALVQGAPRLTREQLETLSPQTLAFPELVTPLDAQIALEIAERFPPLNLDAHGWRLTYCRELDADRDAGRFYEAETLKDLGAERDGLYWRTSDGREWWPLVEGFLFYHLEFPVEGAEPKYWVDADEVKAIEGRKNDDGTSVFEHLRIGWRLVASATNERSVVAAVLPPRTACKHSVQTVWGGTLDKSSVLALAGALSSFVVDFLIRFSGRTNLTYTAMNSLPFPPKQALFDRSVDHLVEKLFNIPKPQLWDIGLVRADLDALIAQAFGLDLRRYVAVLSSFPLLDRTQPMLPGERKSFITRDLALLSYSNLLNVESPDIVELLDEAGIELPKPKDEMRIVADRVAAARKLGALPYRPTPKGGRPPTDPALIEAVVQVLDSDPRSVEEIAEIVHEERDSVKKVLESLCQEGDCHAQGRGATRSYYLLED